MPPVTPKKVLATISTLEETNKLVVLGLEIAGVIVPIVKAAIRGIHQIATGSETVSYAVLVQVDSAELDAIDKLSIDDLTAINLELVKAGAKPLPLPPAG